VVHKYGNTTNTNCQQVPAWSLKQYALSYALQGIAVLPLQPGGKEPAGWLVPHGHHDATTDLETIAGWWDQCPDANIGGAVLKSGMLALDLDPRNGGAVDCLEDLPGTVTSLSGRGDGGQHRLYKVPKDVAVRSFTFREGVDVVATSPGYIVLPPSIHPVTGQPYQWAQGQSIWDREPAMVPGKVLEGLRKANYSSSPPPAKLSEGRYTAPFLELLDQLGVAYDPGKRKQLVQCPFPGHKHNDASPSLSLDLQEGTYKCHAPKCATNQVDGRGGGYKRLAELAQKEFGLVAGVHYDGHDLWHITTEDWKQCPACATLHQYLGKDLRLHLTHWWCGRKDCPVYSKVALKEWLGPVQAWEAMHLAVVDEGTYQKFRKTATEPAQDFRAFPMGQDQVLLATKQPYGREVDMVEGLAQCASAYLHTPPDKRARRPSWAVPEAHQLETAGDLGEGLHSDMVRLDLVPDGRKLLLKVWQACGIEPTTGTAGTQSKDPLSLQQVRKLADLVRQLGERPGWWHPPTRLATESSSVPNPKPPPMVIPPWEVPRLAGQGYTFERVPLN